MSAPRAAAQLFRIAMSLEYFIPPATTRAGTAQSTLRSSVWGDLRPSCLTLRRRSGFGAQEAATEDGRAIPTKALNAALRACSETLEKKDGKLLDDFVK